MNIPLTPELQREAATYGLRSSCVHCAYYVQADRSCAHGWPNEDQRRWPWEPPEAHFCKEFELR